MIVAEMMSARRAPEAVVLVLLVIALIYMIFIILFVVNHPTFFCQ